jgi:hypothetical protein
LAPDKNKPSPLFEAMELKMPSFLSLLKAGARFTPFDRDLLAKKRNRSFFFSATEEHKPYIKAEHIFSNLDKMKEYANKRSVKDDHELKAIQKFETKLQSALLADVVTHYEDFMKIYRTVGVLRQSCCNHAKHEKITQLTNLMSNAFEQYCNGLSNSEAITIILKTKTESLAEQIQRDYYKSSFWARLFGLRDDFSSSIKSKLGRLDRQPEHYRGSKLNGKMAADYSRARFGF